MCCIYFLTGQVLCNDFTKLVHLVVPFLGMAERQVKVRVKREFSSQFVSIILKKSKIEIARDVRNSYVRIQETSRRDWSQD